MSGEDKDEDLIETVQSAPDRLAAPNKKDADEDEKKKDDKKDD